jgi:hypothetical protein
VAGDVTIFGDTGVSIVATVLTLVVDLLMFLFAGWLVYVFLKGPGKARRPDFNKTIGLIGYAKFPAFTLGILVAILTPVLVGSLDPNQENFGLGAFCGALVGLFVIWIFMLIWGLWVHSHAASVANDVSLGTAFAFTLLAWVIAGIIIIGVSAVTLGLGDGPSDQGPTTIKPERLEDWSWSSEAISDYLEEGGIDFGVYSRFELDSLVPANGTFFVNSVRLTLEWEDEPDQNLGPRLKTNEPDTFQVEIAVSMDINMISPETSNDPSSRQGSISLNLDMASHGYSYFIIGNASELNLGDDILVDTRADVNVYMIEAGDYHSPPPEFLFINDFGNDYTLTISLSGKILPA